LNNNEFTYLHHMLYDVLQQLKKLEKKLDEIIRNFYSTSKEKYNG